MKFSPLLIALLVLPLSAFAQKPTPTPAFKMPVEDVFSISGRGTVATGKIERGSLKVGDMVEIVGIKETRSTAVVAIEMFRKLVNEANAGDTVGVMLRGIEPTDVERGQVLAKPGSIKAYTTFRAKIDMVPAAEGGRKAPLTNGSRLQVMIGAGSFSGTMIFAGGRSKAAAGEKAIEIQVELTQPAALETGASITLRENGKTVAAGVVIAVIPPK